MFLSNCSTCSLSQAHEIIKVINKIQSISQAFFLLLSSKETFKRTVTIRCWFSKAAHGEHWVFFLLAVHGYPRNNESTFFLMCSMNWVCSQSTQRTVIFFVLFWSFWNVLETSSAQYSTMGRANTAFWSHINLFQTGDWSISNLHKAQTRLSVVCVILLQLN